MSSMDEDSPTVEVAPSATPQSLSSSGAGRRPVPNGTDPGPSGAATVAHNAPGISRRRRGIGIVTANACTECRKKRAKCDGGTPCGRCKAQSNAECVYELPVRQSKETLRHEIDQLRRHQRNSDSIFAALVRADLTEEVLTRLRAGQTIDGVADWLDSPPGSAGKGAIPPPQSGGFAAAVGFTDDHGPSFGPYGPGPMTASPLSSHNNSPWGGNFSTHSHTMSTMSDSRPDKMNVEVVLQPDQSNTPVHAGTWTSITADVNLVRHLLSLYFCWEYPTFASLSKEHFLDDFSSGRQRYCSSILVNALLALGCRFSTEPSTRANPDDPYTSGDHFFGESQRLFQQEESHHTLTTIQALGIMSIREASCGRDSESWYYAGQSIRLAIEMGLHQRSSSSGDEAEIAVRAATFWGAFALDHAWSLATGSLPQTACITHLPPKPAIIDDIEASLWIPYTDAGVSPQRSCEQPSNVRSVYKCFCELSELVHQSLYILHSPGRPLTSQDLLQSYTQYLNWYDRIPEVLRLGHNFTPAVLFAHMYYHFAILLLFKPLIKLRIIGSSLTPRDVCSQAADAIQNLLRSYAQLYTLRRTPAFVPYFVLTSSIMHLTIAAASLPSSSSGPRLIHGAEDRMRLEGQSEASDMQQEPQQAQRQGHQLQQQHAPSRQEQQAAALDPHVVRTIGQGIADLVEMAPCHQFAEQALNILRYLAKQWHLDVDMSGKKEDEGGVLARNNPSDEEHLQKQQHQQEQQGNHGRSIRPVTSSLNFFALDFHEQDMICSLAGEKKSRNEQSDSTQNPVFWSFPLQGRPMLPSGPQLREHGFEML